MLQPAASTVTTSLALTPVSQAGTAENPEIPEGFAALLALGLSSVSETDGAAPLAAEQFTPDERQTGKATGKTGGKAGGNILPVLQGDVGMPPVDAVVPDANARPPVASEETASADEPPAEAAPTAVPVPLIPTPLAIALALPVAIVPSRARASEAASHPEPAKAASAVQAAPTRAGTPTAPTPPALVPAPLAAALPVTAITPAVAAAEVHPAPSTDAKADKAPAQPTPTADAAKLVPAAPPAQKPETALQMPVPVATPVVMAQPDQAAKPASGRPGAAPAAPAREAPAAAPTRSAAVAADISALDPVKPLAAELQPVIALRDAQSAAQISANPPVVTTANTAPQPGHDFAALVDRLVEARDALAPQTVRAAIHHSEFGQVSLRFQSDDNQLTVSMTSADPDFAPSVQAAAAAQPAATADNGASSQRHEAQGQQSTSQQPGSAASGQSQAQSQGSARGAERDRAENFRQPANGEAPQDQDRPRAGRSGIYA